MNRIIQALTENKWAMEPKILDQLTAVVLRHSDGEKLPSEEIEAIVAARGDRGETDEGLQITRDGVAIVPIQGVITKGAKSVDRVSQPRGTATGEIQTNIFRALQDPSVRAIVLDIDSPGGSVKGIEETANAIFKARKQKPIVAFASDMTASAAYWLGSQANSFLGNATAAVGSIGVYMIVVDSSEAAKKVGARVLKVATGPFKGAGEPGTIVTDEQLAAFQTEVDDILDVFTKQVSRGRGMSRDSVRAVADGRTFIGKDAVTLGLLDQIGSINDAITEATRLADGGSARAQEETTVVVGTSHDQLQAAKSDDCEIARTFAASTRAAVVTPQQNKETDMGDKYAPSDDGQKETTAAETVATVEKTVIESTKTVDVVKVRSEAAATATEEERARAKEIRALSREHDLGDEWCDEMCDSKMSLSDVRIKALDLISANQNVTIKVGEDLNLSTMASAIEDSLQLRAGLVLENPHPRSSHFIGRTIVEGARIYLESYGVDCNGLSRAGIMKAAIAPGRYQAASGGFGNYTGDYPKILENIISKRLRAGYDENPGSWREPGLMTTGTLPDFKEASMVALGAAADLSVVSEGGTYTEMTIPETREKFTLVKYGKLYSFTWEQMINDDLNAFNRIPFLMGAAASRLENVTAWNPLTIAQLGATLNEDSKTIFHSDHKNYDTAGGVLDEGLLTVMKLLMRKQYAPQDANGTSAKLNLIPRFLVAPPELEHTALQLINSSATMESNKNAGVINVHQGSLKIVVEPLLSAVPTTGLTGSYLFADTSQIDTIHVAFLEGEQTPMMDREDGFASDGIRHKIRHTIVSKAIDFRGMVYADGTT